MTRQSISYDVDNVTAPVVRQQINAIFNAIQTLNAGTGTPTSAQGLVANFMFIDDDANSTPPSPTLNIRNSGNSNNIVLFKLDQTNNRVELVTDDIQYATSSGTEVKNTSGTTVLSLQVPSQSTAQTGTENTQVMTPLRVKQSITANAITSLSAGQGIDVSGSTVSMETHFINRTAGQNTEFDEISGTSFTNSGAHPLLVVGRSNTQSGGSFTFEVRYRNSNNTANRDQTCDMRDSDSGTHDTFCVLLPQSARVSSSVSFVGLAMPFVVG